MFKKIKEYLAYPSTKTALISIASACGIVVNPALVEYIVAAALAAMGIIDLFKSDVDVIKRK